MVYMHVIWSEHKSWVRLHLELILQPIFPYQYLVLIFPPTLFSLILISTTTFHLVCGLRCCMLALKK